MRAFIAIELPKEIKDYLAKLQDELKSSGADVKWVTPRNIHLTLKFLGEIDEAQTEKIISILQETAADNAQFDMEISGTGAFPKLDSPRVVWAGVGLGEKETKKIAKELEGRIQKTGIPKEERAFSSHITLGRVKSGLNREKLIQRLTAAAETYGQKKIRFRVNKIVLFKSTLSAGGPTYEALAEANLTTI